MRLLYAICLLGFSTVALADVTAADVRASTSQMNQACGNSGSSSACGEAVRQNQNMSNQLNREIGASLNRDEYGDQRRVRVQEEERWREEARRR